MDLFTLNYFAGFFFICFILVYSFRLTKKNVNAASFRPRESHVTSCHVVQPLPTDLERRHSAVSCRLSLAPRTVNMLFRDKRGSCSSLKLLLWLLACLGYLSVCSGAAEDDSLWYRDLCG